MNTIQIAIAESQLYFSHELYTQLNTWADSHNQAISIDVFDESATFLDQKSFPYHVIFLSIESSSTNGIDIANYLKENGYLNQIVFTTSYPPFALLTYQIQPLRFLFKPTSQQDLNFCMDIVAGLYTACYYTFKNRGQIISIAMEDIIYCTSSDHNVDIITTKETYSQRISISNIKNHLPAQFQQCHRTAILNTAHIKKLVNRDAYLTNDHVVPISPTYLDSIKKVLLKKHTIPTM